MLSMSIPALLLYILWCVPILRPYSELNPRKFYQWGNKLSVMVSQKSSPKYSCILLSFRPSKSLVVHKLMKWCACSSSNFLSFSYIFVYVRLNEDIFISYIVYDFQSLKNLCTQERNICALTVSSLSDYKGKEGKGVYTLIIVDI